MPHVRAKSLTEHKSSFLNKLKKAFDLPTSGSSSPRASNSPQTAPTKTHSSKAYPSSKTKEGLRSLVSDPSSPTILSRSNSAQHKPKAIEDEDSDLGGGFGLDSHHGDDSSGSGGSKDDFLHLSLEPDAANNGDFVRKLSAGSESPPPITIRLSKVSHQVASAKLLSALEDAKHAGAGFRIENSPGSDPFTFSFWKSHKVVTPEQQSRVVEAALNVMDALLLLDREPAGHLSRMLMDYVAEDYGLYGILVAATSHKLQNKAIVTAANDQRAKYKYAYVAAVLLHKKSEKVLKNVVFKDDLMSILFSFFYSSESLDRSECAAVCIIIIDIIHKSRVLENKLIKHTETDSKLIIGLTRHLYCLSASELLSLLVARHLTLLPVIANSDVQKEIHAKFKESLQILQKESTKSSEVKFKRAYYHLWFGLDFIFKSAIVVLRMKFGLLHHEHQYLSTYQIEHINASIAVLHPMINPPSILDLIGPILQLQPVDPVDKLAIQTLKIHAIKIVSDLLYNANVVYRSILVIQQSKETQLIQSSVILQSRPSLGNITWDLTAFEQQYLVFVLTFLAHLNATDMTKPYTTYEFAVMEAIMIFLEFCSEASAKTVVEAGGVKMCIKALRGLPSCSVRQQFILLHLKAMIMSPQTSTVVKKEIFETQKLLEFVTELIEYQDEVGFHPFQCHVSGFVDFLVSYFDKLHNHQHDLPFVSPEEIKGFRVYVDERVKPYMQDRHGYLAAKAHPKTFVKSRANAPVGNTFNILVHK